MARIRQIVMDASGDTRHDVDVADKVSLERANARFKELTGLGFLAYAPGQDGAPGKVLKDFDATEETTIFRPRLIGG
jgi:hypothetical protein